MWKLLLGSLLAILPLTAQTPSWTGLVEGTDQFTLDLYKAISPAPGNLIISPFSLSTALAIPYVGAKGRTAQEMQRVLYYPQVGGAALAQIFTDLADHLSSDKGEGLELRIARSLWVQEDLSLAHPFQKVMEETFRGGLQEVDFKMPKIARREINAWVKEETGGRITDLMPEGSVTPADRMISVSALYLRANWTLPFDPRKTQDEPFSISPSQQIKTPLMHGQMRLPHLAGDRLEAIALPYEGGKEGVQLAMLILLPKTGELGEFEQALSLDLLKGILEQMSLKEVAVTLPRFRMSTRLYAKDVLEGLGMTTPFSRQADFSGIDGGKGLQLNAAIHQAYIDVDEYGTEATAASAVSVGVTSAPAKESEVAFVADHPFLTVVLDAGSGQILFIGRVENPSSEV
ncbi:MAG: serpin family protein [Parachlamydiales bacterium]